MKIAIFGLGYVGATAAACLARHGHRVIGVDNSAVKVNAIANGRLPFREPGLEALLAEGVACGRLTVTADAAAAVAAADMSMVCVGTPASADGSLDTAALLAVVSEITRGMELKAERHCLIIRSTVVPGTIDELIVPTIERQAGLVAGRDYGLSYFPEFLREGSALADHESPPTLVYGASDDGTARLLDELTAGTGTAAERVDFRTAEAIKLLNNAWHAAKVGFANEMGLILKRSGVDSHRAFALLCSDRTLNIAPAYLTPGFAFGGSCLPKDLSLIREVGHAAGLETPYIDGLLAANQRQIDEAVLLVKASGCRTVTLVGLAFKPGTDDLRNSPYVELAFALMALGYPLRIVDSNVEPAQLVGANRDYASSRLPDLGRKLYRDIGMALDGCELLIVADRRQAEAEIATIAAHRPAILDLARSDPIAALGLRYTGIAW